MKWTLCIGLLTALCTGCATSVVGGGRSIANSARTILDAAIATDQGPAVATDVVSPDVEVFIADDKAPPRENGRGIQQPKAHSPELTLPKSEPGLAQRTGQPPPAREEVTPPRPQAFASSQFEPGPGEADIDRFNRRIAEVPVDIRPTEGTMPGNLVPAPRGEEPLPAEREEAAERGPVVCSYSPWTLCYRPLYFEEVALERFGTNCGCFQSAISGAHFFTNVAALPYKMTVRCPRSCLCSNGFSRCGDPIPPGYNDCVWRWDAAAVQAGVVLGIVAILP